MSFDPKKMKKISSTKSHTVFSHPDGHFIKISHRNLGQEKAGAIKRAAEKLAEGGIVGLKELYKDPNYADGGIVDKEQADIFGKALGTKDEPPKPSPSPAPKKMADGGMVDQPNAQQSTMDFMQRNMAPAVAPSESVNPQINPQAMATPQEQAASAVENYPLTQQAQPQQQGDPFGTQTYIQGLEQGIGEQRAGIGQQLQAEEAAGKAQARVAGEEVSHLQRIERNYNSHLASLNKERETFLQDVQNNHVDPHRYVNNMSTGKQIMTGIGLILGGIGGGMTGQGNAALAFLEKNIDRDIDAQKMEMGKKENLLKANLHQFGNLHDATNMTRAMSMDLLSAKLKQAAASAASPMARANALKAAGELDLKIAPIMSQLAMKKTLLGGEGAGGKSRPEAVIHAIVPPEQQEKVFSELKTAQDMQKGHEDLLSAIDKVNELNTLGNRIAHAGFEPPKVTAIREPILARLSKESAGRLTPQDVDMLKALFPAPGDSDSTVKLKRDQADQFMRQKFNFPQLDLYGIKPGLKAYKPIQAPKGYK